MNAALVPPAESMTREIYEEHFQRRRSQASMVDREDVD